ncbi:MAG: oligosaccharide repeat unit polymerase, partial [Candidatus Aminicenantes bacterium]|nr:oligosaccharide repeat unit polymerase [Candidatus Aminicenantes bacterium]
MKQKIIILKISILVVFSIKYFQNFPFEKIFFKIQSVIIVGLIGFIIYYVTYKLLNNKSFQDYELIIIFIAIFFPLFSTFRANIIFGQPIIFGLLKERTWITIISGVVIISQLSNNKWSVKNLQTAFLFLSWVSLIFFLYLYLFADSSQFDNSFVLFPRYKLIHYKLSPYFIVFGFIYYFIKFIIQKKMKYLLLILPFISFIVLFDKGRGLIITVFITIMLIILSYKKFKFKNSGLFITISLLLIIVVFSIFLSSSSQLVNSFKEIFNSLNFDEVSLESSVKVRIFEINEVMSFTIDHPDIILWGSGGLSNQWNGGYSGQFIYFYPSDIGIIGVWFVYGLIGIIVILLQVFIVFT